MIMFSSFINRLLHLLFFFFNDTATTEIYTLSLHDALPISSNRSAPESSGSITCSRPMSKRPGAATSSRASAASWVPGARSEEHTSELQSHLNLVCRLLLEKKKNMM